MRAVSSEAPTRDGALPVPRSAVLDNGLKVLIEEAHTAPLVSVWCWYRVGSIPRSLETNEGIARFLQTTEQFDLGLDYDRRLAGLVQSVTADAVAEAARRTFVTEHAAIVIAGPYEES